MDIVDGFGVFPEISGGYPPPCGAPWRLMPLLVVIERDGTESLSHKSLPGDTPEDSPEASHALPQGGPGIPTLSPDTPRTPTLSPRVVTKRIIVLVMDVLDRFVFFCWGDIGLLRTRLCFP